MKKDQIRNTLENVLSPDATTRMDAEIQMKRFIADDFATFCDVFLELAFDSQVNAQANTVALIILKNAFNGHNNETLAENWAKATAEFRNNFLQKLENLLITKNTNQLKLLSKIYANVIVMNKLYHRNDQKTDAFLDRFLENISNSEYAIGILAYTEQTIVDLDTKGYEFDLKEVQLIKTLTLYYTENSTGNTTITIASLDAIYETIDVYAKLLTDSSIRKIVDVIEQNISQPKVTERGIDIFNVYIDAIFNDEKSIVNKEHLDITSGITEYTFNLLRRTNTSLVEFCDLITVLIEILNTKRHYEFFYNLLDTKTDDLIKMLLSALKFEYSEDVDYTPHKAACKLLQIISSNQQMQFKEKVVEKQFVQQFIINKLTASSTEEVATGAIALGCVVTATNRQLSDFYQKSVEILIKFIKDETASNNILYALSRICEIDINLILMHLEQITIECGQLINSPTDQSINAIWFYYNTFVAVRKLPVSVEYQDRLSQIHSLMSNYVHHIICALITKLDQTPLDDSITRNALASALYEAIQFPMDQSLLINLTEHIQNELNKSILEMNKTNFILLEDKVCTMLMLLTVSMCNLNTINDTDGYFITIGKLIKMPESLIQGEVFMSLSKMVTTNRIDINNDQIHQNYIIPLVDTALVTMNTNKEPFSANASCCFVSDYITQISNQNELIRILPKIIDQLLGVIKRQDSRFIEAKMIVIAMLGDLALITGVAFSEYVRSVAQMYQFVNNALAEFEIGENAEMCRLLKSVLQTVDCVVVGLGGSSELKQNISQIVGCMHSTTKIAMRHRLDLFDKPLLNLIKDIYKRYRVKDLKSQWSYEFLRFVLLKNEDNSECASTIINMLTQE